MATNDVLGKLGRSNIKSQGPLLWAQKQPNGSIREALFLSFSSLERENKLKLICIKCLSRQTCPLRGDHAKIPHPARCKQGGGGKVGGICAYPHECVLSQLTRNEPVNFLALSMRHARISLLSVRARIK